MRPARLARIGLPAAALNLIAGCAVDFAGAGLPANLVAADVKPAPAAVTAFLEGPAADADGSVYFSDIAGNRILRLAGDGKVSVFRADSGRTNGNAFDREGRLISCEGNEQGPGRRRIVRTDLKSGNVEVLTDNYRGKRYNAPNDVAVDAKGRIWFTDPYYGTDRGFMELPEAVYRIDPDGKVTMVLWHPHEIVAVNGKEKPVPALRTEEVRRRIPEVPAIGRPNGIAVTADAKTLYVVDSDYIAPGANRKIWAFDIDGAGNVSNQREVFDFGRGRGGDGIRLDTDGNIWATAGIMYPRTANEDGSVPPGVYVISPAGKLLGRIPINEDVITNCEFGGPDGRTLYVTAGKTLYKFAVNATGQSIRSRR
jgi:gluconolactonase